ncbi:MAPEG family protein [Lacimicrobium sp. SS2-24]|uniref:MAPEG family protein n=1 Tax=Lacimicrobium sp. SS2-24 TaxID=2005569 RepID=UPI000B4B68B9|nr:MAPEG family protein [Lacimicrobium sp. SS2-24]
MITLFYTGILSLLVAFLSARVIVLRNQHKVAIGDGNNPQLQLAIRAQGNALEYLPLALLMIFMLEALGLSAGVIHGLCLLLLGGRVVHAYAIVAGNMRLRVLGMLFTFMVLLAGAGIAIGFTLPRLGWGG